MARNLVVNGVTYPDVESLTMTDADGEEVNYVEEGSGGSSGGDSGGLPAGISALATGEYTPASDQTCPVSIPHGLGVTPNVINFAIADEIISVKDIAGYLAYYAATTLKVAGNVGSYMFRYVLSTGGFSSSGYNVTSQADLATEADIIIPNERMVLKGGQTYRWVAVVLDDL